MTTSYPYGYYPPSAPPPPPPPPPQRPNRRPLTLALVGGATAAALVLGGVAIGQATSTTVSGNGAIAQVPSLPGNGGLFPGVPNGRSGRSNSAHGPTQASARQQVGVVTILSVLKYQNAESAGTGMILTSNGEVLTNNHVINGATKIMVTVQSTGHTYRARVEGTAPTRDIAVLQLQNASGLRTAPLASSSSALAVGSTVTGVGNAGGTGRLTQATGKVTGLDQTITASDEGGVNAERLTGLIKTNAAIISGDSGGPLFDSSGQVVGMDTAASANPTVRSTAYAIPVENAMSVAGAIESGVETTSIHIGLPGFLGVGLAKAGTKVVDLLPGGPARAAGITAGSRIESVDGTAVHSATQLHNLLSEKGPGASVQVAWTDAMGTSHSATVVLATGPAD